MSAGDGELDSLGMNWYVVHYVGLPQPGVGDFVCTSENLKVSSWVVCVYMCGSKEMRSIGPNNDSMIF